MIQYKYHISEEYYILQFLLVFARDVFCLLNQLEYVIQVSQVKQLKYYISIEYS